MLYQDNSALRHKTMSLFEQGSMKYTQGETLKMKNEGLQLTIQGLKQLQLWIDRENDQVLKQQLKKQYEQKYEEVGGMLETLEKYQQQSNQQTNSDGSQMKKKGQGGDTDDENEKFKKGLAESIVTELPNVKWEDIAGLDRAKESLQEAVILPIKFPNFFTGVRKPWVGILLYGPPGTGKTYLAKACATEAKGTFFSISSSDLISKYVGESEKLIKALFQMAREKKPSIIFIDEVDSLAGARTDGENEATRRVKTELLVQMQGVGHDNQGILVLGATNLPWAIDPAIRRRFEKRIYIPLPEEGGRTYLFNKLLKDTPNTLNPSDIQKLGQMTEGLSGADIGIVVRDASFEPIRQMQSANYFKQINENGQLKYVPVGDQLADQPGVKKIKLYELKETEISMPKITMENFISALKRCKPTVGPEDLKQQEQFTKDFGQDG